MSNGANNHEDTLLNERINIRGEIESIHATLAEREKLDLEREKRLDERSLAAKEAVTAALSAADMATKAAFAASEKATDKAFEAASTLSQAHNDLLRKMERQGETFATKESMAGLETALARAQVGGGLLAAGVLTVIVKLFLA